MNPKFASLHTWNQAELLMQPALIRVIDNIRKELERSPWRGTYRDVLVWPDGTTPEIQNQVLSLQKAMETASEHEIVTLQHQLDALPRPYPGYHLCLSYQNQEIEVDLWQLCYEVCFVNLDPNPTHQMTEAVEIDLSLICDDQDVDWQKLDEKAKQVVGQVFSHLTAS